MLLSRLFTTPKQSKRITNLVLASVFIASLTGCNLDSFKSVDSLKAEVHQSLDTKNFSDAASAAQRLTDKAPGEYEGYFLLAQAKAQVGDKSAAIVALEQAIKKGLKDDNLIEKNVNLDPIKQMSAYQDLMNGSFPSRQSLKDQANNASGADASNAVSIREVDGKAVVRAGDVVVEVPAAK